MRAHHSSSYAFCSALKSRSATARRQPARVRLSEAQTQTRQQMVPLPPRRDLLRRLAAEPARTLAGHRPALVGVQLQRLAAVRLRAQRLRHCRRRRGTNAMAAAFRRRTFLISASVSSAEPSPRPSASYGLASRVSAMAARRRGAAAPGRASLPWPAAANAVPRAGKRRRDAANEVVVSGLGGEREVAAVPESDGRRRVRSRSRRLAWPLDEQRANAESRCVKTRNQKHVSEFAYVQREGVMMMGSVLREPRLEAHERACLLPPRLGSAVEQHGLHGHEVDCEGHALSGKAAARCRGVSSAGAPCSSNHEAFLLRRSRSRMTRMSAVLAAVLNTSCHSVALSMPARDEMEAREYGRAGSATNPRHVP